MVELPFGLVIDLDSIAIWFNELYIQCIPDFESLLNAKLSTTFSLFTDKLWIATSATYTACESWIKLLFYLCRLIVHIILLSYPYIKPIFVKSYTYWNSLDLTVQLSIIGFILFILITYWIKKNHYIQRTTNYFHHKLQKIKHWFGSKWHKLISWISTRSKMTAKIFPHLIWWFILFSLIWFVPEHTYALHHVLLFIGCFIVPLLKTYSIIRKYSHFIKLYSNTEDTQNSYVHQCINPLQTWLQFWCCRAFIIFSYYMCCYVLSYIPAFIITSITTYISINNTLFEIICDWAILSLLVTNDSFSKQLTTKIFQMNSASHQRTEISSNINRSSLADKISLSSINSLLQFMLKFIRPFVPSFIYNIIHDGLYQFLIFFSFLFFSAVLGSYMLGYLLPIYTSILALHNLQQLQHKISFWNNNQRQNLTTPEKSEVNTPLTQKNNSKSANNLRSRKNGKTTSTNINVLSPEKNESNRSWSLWSLIPSNMFSFHGTDEFDKNERKRQQLHEEANDIINNIVNRLKYWVVFATIEWIYYFIGQQLGAENWIPLWNYIKFALILWIQLPYVPYSCAKIYEYIILPVRILDINHIDVNQKKNDDINVIVNDNNHGKDKARKSFTNSKKYDESVIENKRNDVVEEKSKLLT